MGIYVLSDGKKLRTPAGLSKKQTVEWLFENLKDKPAYADDVKKLGDKLDTSGWGATIGGALGGIAGTIGGAFFGGSGAIPGGAAGGAAGAALGEGVEQWWTGGKGDWTDVGTSALIGGATGGIGGGALGAATKFGAKGAAAVGGAAGAVEGGREGGTAGALAGAAAGAATGGLGGGLLTKGLSVASQKLGLDKPVKSAVEIGKDFGKDYLNAQWLKITGRGAAGGLQQSAAVWQLRRDVANKIFKESKKNLLKGKRRRKLTSAEENDLRKASDLEAADLIKARKEYGEFKRAQNTLTSSGKPKMRAEKHKGQDVFVDEQGVMYDPKTGQSIGDFAMGGLIPGYNEGGKVRQRRRQDPKGRYKERVADAGISPADLLDFVPIIGDIKGAAEVVQEMNKPNPNWPLIGALAGATIIGVIPGIGDAAAAGIKAGAKAGLKAVDGGIELAKRIEVDPDAVGSFGGNVRLKPTPKADLDEYHAWQDALPLDDKYKYGSYLEELTYNPEAKPPAGYRPHPLQDGKNVVEFTDVKAGKYARGGLIYGRKKPKKAGLLY